MLTKLRWISLVLAVSALIAWAAVSSLRLAYQFPHHLSMEDRRIADPTVYEFYRPPMSIGSVMRDDIVLRIATAVLVSAHLVILNWPTNPPSKRP